LGFSGSTSGRGFTTTGVADDLFALRHADADVVQPPAGPSYIIFLMNGLHICKKKISSFLPNFNAMRLMFSSNGMGFTSLKD
jgi:hypothetical protein